MQPVPRLREYFLRQLKRIASQARVDVLRGAHTTGGGGRFEFVSQCEAKKMNKN